MTSLSEFRAAEKKKYLVLCQEDGGTAPGYREHISSLASKDPMLFKAWQMEALMEAATKKWQSPPRKHGPDLFSIAGEEIPEHLTRPSSDFDGQDIDEDDERAFEKVDTDYATVDDLFQDALIKMRKAAQSSAAAEQKMKLANEAKRRAKGNIGAFLRDIADKADGEVA
jgi:hypothetical protein